MSPETHPRTDIVLTIQAEGGGYRYHVRVNGEAVVSNASVANPAGRHLTKLTEDLEEVFEAKDRPFVRPENLTAVGSFLFDLWLGEHWEKIAEKFPHGSHRWLVISSDVPTILDLPWELLRLPAGDVLGTDARYGIRRMPWLDGGLAKGPEQLRAGPLRVLFMACSPRGLAELDYEKEEEAVREAIVKATAGHGNTVAFDSCDLGTFDELQERVAAFKPHIVHLTGHGQVIDELGHFAFEDESGDLDLRFSDEIRQRIFAGSDVQCVFVSGCQSGRTPPVTAIGGVCQGLVSVDVPFGIGWAASIIDSEATKLAGKLYGLVAAGERIDRALALARAELAETITVEGQQVVDASWILPVLYASTDQEVLFDSNPERKTEIPARRMMRVEALPGMTAGHAVHFVGRRREQQQLIPSLRSGTEVQTVILTGIGGAGKSTLATRLARKLEQEGFTPLAITSFEDAPLSVGTLFERVGDAFLSAGMQDVWQLLQNGDIPVETRLKLIVTALNKGRFVVVLDNFETNLDRESRRILSTELAGFYKHILPNLSGGSRLIITSRHLPTDVADLPPTVKHMDLMEFSEASFLKFLLRDETVEERYSTGDLPHELLTKLHESVGGTPRFLEQIRTALVEMSAEALQGHLDEIDLPDETDENANHIQDLKDEYCESIFAGELYGYLTPESQVALSKAALFSIPISIAGIAYTAEIDPSQAEDFVQEWRERTFAYPSASHSDSSTWAINTVLRDWLTGKLSPDAREATCAKAGRFLSGLDIETEIAPPIYDRLTVWKEALRLLLIGNDEGGVIEVAIRIANELDLAGLNQDLESHVSWFLARHDHPLLMGLLGRSHLNRGEYRRAREWYGRSLDNARENKAARARALYGLARIDFKQGLHDAARSLLYEVLELLGEDQDLDGKAAALNLLANLDASQGRYDSANARLEDVLAINRRIANRRGISGALASMASISIHRGDYDAARARLLEACEVKREIGDRAGEAGVIHELVTVAISQRDFEAARTNAMASLSIFRELEDRGGEADTLVQLATIDAERGFLDSARKVLLEALDVQREIGARAGEATTLHNLATIDLRRKDYASSRMNFVQALTIAQEIGDRSGEASTIFQMGCLAEAMGNQEGGMGLFLLCAHIDSQIGSKAADSDLEAAKDIAVQLGYTSRQLEHITSQIVRSYEADKGKAIVEAELGLA